MKTIPNSFPIWRESKVINTADPEKLGRIQLKVYPELSEIPDADCPWCFPHSGGVHGKSFGVPLAGQLITCVVWNRYWNEITFLPFNITKPTEHLFDDWMSKRRSEVTDMETDPEEEHLIVDQYEDDFTIFHDTKNNQHGYLHPAGTFFIINKDGSIWMQSVKNMTFHNKDDTVLTTVDSESGNIEIKTKGGVKETIDKDLERIINGQVKDVVTGPAKYESADTDIKSTAPIGLNDGLYVTGLGPYLSSETAAMTALQTAAGLAAPQLSVLDGFSGGASTIIGLGTAIIAFCQAMMSADTAAHSTISKAVK